MIASGKNSKTDNIKVAILLNLLGDEGFEYENPEDATKLETVINKFELYCKPLKNIVYEHFKFFKRDQLPGERIDQFIKALRNLASTCDFKEGDTLILDRIVLGVSDARMQERLLQKPDLKLSEAIDICRSMENSKVT